MENATHLTHECEKEIFCGIPFYLGIYHGNRDHSVWIPADPPRFEQRPSLTLMKQSQSYSTTNANATAKQYTFTIKGPSRMSIHLSPVKGAKMTRCTLLDDDLPPAKIKWHGRDVYFINFTVGKRSLQWNNIEFTVEIESSLKVNRPYLMDIGFVAQFINNYKTHTDQFKNFVNSFPKWTNVQNWTSIYQGYQF